MTFSRIVLVLGAVCFGAVGLVFVIAPAPILAQLELDLSNPAARTDVRAVYGGLDIGVALFLAWCAAAAGRVRSGLVAMTCCFGAILAARLFGVLVDGSTDSLTLTLLSIEAAGTVLGVAGLASGGTVRS